MNPRAYYQCLGDSVLIGPSTSMLISSSGHVDNLFLRSMGDRLVFAGKLSVHNTLFTVLNVNLGTSSNTLETSKDLSGLICPNYINHDVAMSVESVICPPKIRF